MLATSLVLASKAGCGNKEINFPRKEIKNPYFLCSKINSLKNEKKSFLFFDKTIKK